MKMMLCYLLDDKHLSFNQSIRTIFFAIGRVIIIDSLVENLTCMKDRKLEIEGFKRDSD